MYIHNVSQYEDWAVAIVFTFWIYDWAEDRVRRFVKWNNLRKASKEIKA